MNDKPVSELKEVKSTSSASKKSENVTKLTEKQKILLESLLKKQFLKKKYHIRKW